jgi:8-oxo-dGTP diphosphatase|tara:strand:- start:6461 stop:6889 length:429 start_codon:yes stop_codon:yes gene_type:complete
MNSCNILILNKKNQFLLQLRDKNKNIKSPNHWCLFGGLKKKDETYIQCINREVKEELNITIKKPEFLTKISYSYKTNNKKLHTKYFYFMKLDKTQINNMKLNEGQKMKFFSYKQIFKLANIVVWDIYSIMYYKKYYKKINAV